MRLVQARDACTRATIEYAAAEQRIAQFYQLKFQPTLDRIENDIETAVNTHSAAMRGCGLPELVRYVCYIALILTSVSAARLRRAAEGHAASHRPALCRLQRRVRHAWQLASGINSRYSRI